MRIGPKTILSCWGCKMLELRQRNVGQGDFIQSAYCKLKEKEIREDWSLDEIITPRWCPAKKLTK